MRRLRLILAVVLAGAALAGCSGGGWERDCGTDAQGFIQCPPGRRPAAPAVSGELLDGGRYDLASTRGDVVVLNFWGSWCAPCRAEIDDLEGTYRATKDRGVAFLGINGRDERDKATAFQAGRVSYPSLYDPAGRLALDFEVPPNAIPATIVLDRQGRIAVVIRQAIRQETLQPVVERIAAEAG